MRFFRPITHFFALAFLDHCARNVTEDLAATRQDLIQAETDWQTQFSDADCFSEAAQELTDENLSLRRRLNDLEEELSWLDYKRAELREESLDP